MAVASWEVQCAWCKTAFQGPRPHLTLSWFWATQFNKQKHASQPPKMHVHFMCDTFGYMVLAQCVLPAPRYHPQMFSENQLLRCPNCPRPTLTLKFQNSTLLAGWNWPRSVGTFQNVEYTSHPATEWHSDTYKMVASMGLLPTQWWFLGIPRAHHMKHFEILLD